MNCRICHSVLDTCICLLPAMPLTDNFVPITGTESEFIQDISIYRCSSCGLVQNPVDFNHEAYYETYEYSSGHSEFTRQFMQAYARAACDAFLKINGCAPHSVLEIGSGDGAQLRAFQDLGVTQVLGVEPSEALVSQSRDIGVPAFKGLFTSELIEHLPGAPFDICISSYTLDHVRNPGDYLLAAHSLLSPGGILAFEVHDLGRIADRAEWCLFEHEHTIYMDSDMAKGVLQRSNFEVIAINPLPENQVRANSLIIIARKSDKAPTAPQVSAADYAWIQDRVHAAIGRIDAWIANLPAEHLLVGFGAGGRGVMTLAALSGHPRFSAVFDSNHQSGRVLTPKTHVPVCGLDRLAEFKDAWCLVFSFGYLAEITETLLASGYRADRIVSLKSLLG